LEILGEGLVWPTQAASWGNICQKVKKGKGAYSSLWIGNPSQSYGASPAIWDHTVLPATRHR